MLSVGSKAPQFNLYDTSKKLVSLESFRGSKLVIAFYPAAFTGVCTKEMCALRDSLSRFNGLNAQIVGISVDSPFSNRVFAQQNGVEFLLLSDYNREAVKAYGVELRDFSGMQGFTAAQRSVFVVDEQGVIRYAWVAEQPGIEPNYAAVEAVLG